jgi:predicted nucleotidyltransferase
MLTVQQIKDTVTDYFKDKPVKSVYLFGSYARGMPGKTVMWI